MAGSKPWEWRPEIVGTADAMYAEYGEDAGWSGIPPYEAVEAIIDIESGGDPKARNDTPMYNGQHATGLMQVVPGLSVTGAYERVTGSPGVTEDALYDPQTNLSVGIIGLAERAKDVQRTGWFGRDASGGPVPQDQGQPEGSGPDWGSTVAIGWFGAGYQDGYGFWQIDESVTDGPSGINGGAYRDRVNAYMSGFGQESSKIAAAGAWRDPSDPERKRTQPYNAWTQNQDGIGEWAFDFIEGAWDQTGGRIPDINIPGTDDILGAIEGAIPRVAMIGAGIALLVGGLLLVKQLALGAAVGA